LPTSLRHVLLAALAVAPACVAAPAEESSVTQDSVCAAGTTVEGIDVSTFQGVVDWHKVASAGKKFAIARISDGTLLDTKFTTNWPAIKAAGMVRGAYQFFEPADDPAVIAKIVVDAVGVLGPGDLPVTADVEVTGGQPAATIVAHLKAWSAAVEAGTGKAPLIYTGPGFWNGSVASTGFSTTPLWVANWGVTCPNLPTGWTGWRFWQYSDTGAVSGITGAVDLDRFNGDEAALTAFVGAAAGTDAGVDGGATGDGGSDGGIDAVNGDAGFPATAKTGGCGCQTGGAGGAGDAAAWLVLGAVVLRRRRAQP
jgi:lysozyme